MIITIAILSCLLAIAYIKIILDHLLKVRFRRSLKQIKNDLWICNQFANKMNYELGGFLEIDFEEIKNGETECNQSEEGQSTQA